MQKQKWCFKVQVNFVDCFNLEAFKEIFMEIKKNLYFIHPKQ